MSQNPFKLFLQHRREPIRAPQDTGIAYVVGRNGAFIVKENAIFRATVPVTTLPMLENVPDANQVEYRLPPLPIHLVHQVVRFFRQVHVEYGTEAILFIRFDPETGAFDFLAPEQWVTPSHCDYDTPNTENPQHLLVGSIHSHGNMSAFHSPTDVEQEAPWDGIHATFGNIRNKAIDIVTSLVVNGTRHKLDPEDVFDGLSVCPWDHWMSVKKPSKKQRRLAAVSVQAINETSWFRSSYSRSHYELDALPDDAQGAPDPSWFERVHRGPRPRSYGIIPSITQIVEALPSDVLPDPPAELPVAPVTDAAISSVPSEADQEKASATSTPEETTEAKSDAPSETTPEQKKEET